MKRIALLIVLFILLVNIPCYAINLDSNNLVDNVIKSLDEERDNWIIRGGTMHYINGHIDSDLRNETWPEYDNDCLVEITHRVFYTETDKCYIRFEKPVDFVVDGNDKIKMIRKIRAVVYEELHERYNTRLAKKEIVLKNKPEVKKPEVKVDVYGLKPL